MTLLVSCDLAPRGLQLLRSTLRLFVHGMSLGRC